ncbi:MAG: ABC transporter permease [Candidatus Heimdallarchaeota archaeon]|nr:ABC transporter permease [Candidatus Heimdallarchaeota archaeon]MBY8993682.1 ABC transporter permease [Candidatus Heimdallarchaeota archaeon]
MKKKSQFGAILRKDLRLVFTWKTILITVFVPFIMMFLIVSLPTIFIGASDTVITICSDDLGSLEQHLNGTVYNINLGDSALAYIQDFVGNTSNLEVDVVDTREEALNLTNSIYIPANFSATTFDGTSKIESRKSSSDISLQGVYFDQIVLRIQEVVDSAILFLNNVTQENLPRIEQISYTPPAGDPESGWSQDTLALAGPFAYAMFILVMLVGNMGRTIGFSKEKEDGTFETMLSITRNRSNLVFSKLIVGFIASLLSILAYFTGSALAGLISLQFFGDPGESFGTEGILALSIQDLLSGKGVVLLLGIVVALVITMLALMTVDTMFSRTVAERVGITVVMGFGLLFYFTVAFDPGTTMFFAQINPFYWIYHSFLSMVDLSFGWVDAIFIGMIIVLLGAMVFLARKSIEREKVLFT